MRSIIVAILMATFSLFDANIGIAQKLMGLVVQKNSKGVDEPIPGANVYWTGTIDGTTTRDNGVFLIERKPDHHRLVISFVGLRSDTIEITDQSNVRIELKSAEELREVTVEGWRPSTHTDYTSSINVAVMNEKELFKAACCNLSESFETNPSIDVAFTDAITGTRQIQMLGLSGPNTMISMENMPGVRGLASSQGIQFIPGTWINSIQVTKGVGSVVNGYESIAGQINVELKKPQESDKVYVNGYVNSSGRTETNLLYTAQPGKKWGTTFLVHGSVRPLEMDQNKDSFLDFPKGSQVDFMNRWVYHSGNGWLGQFSFKYVKDGKQGGQTGFKESEDKFTTNRYGFAINTERFEGVAKLGYQFQGKPYKSYGLQLNIVDHKQESYFGFRSYDAREKSFYGNWIYQSILGNTSHKFKTGISFLYDNYYEVLNNAPLSSLTQQKIFSRNEIVPGAFLEYTYDDLKKFSMIAGVRVDQHNLFGTLFTPRLHAKYFLTPSTTLRASMGRGIRVANIIAENSGFLASARTLVVANQQSDKAYGFRPDKAWNYGVSVNQSFTLNYLPGLITADYFYTNFQNQVVVDYDNSPQAMNFYALKGKSFSHSAQVQLDYQLVRRLDLRLAYRWLDVETDYLTGRRSRPLVPKDRAFINIAYATKNNWKFDFTVQRIGRQRIPNTQSNPVEYQLASYSTPYLIMNVQITRDFGTRWSAYLGVENLTNFKLSNPIVSASNPFGPYFDTSMVWGPVFGRMYYGGLRYRVK